MAFPSLDSAESAAAPRPKIEAARYGVLDAWRGLGAMHVAISHYLHLTFSPIIKYPVIYDGWVFLEFFFVLSGFVIMLIYGDKLRDLPSLLGFFVRRLGRIWPLHIAVLGAFVLAMLVINWAFDPPDWMIIRPDTGPFPWTGLLTDGLLLNAMGIWPEPTWNVPAWSIGGEFYVYLIFGVVCVLSGGRFIGIALGLCALSMTVLATWSPDYLDTDSRLGIFRCLNGFFLGALAFHLHKFATRRWLARGPESGRSLVATAFEAGLIAAVVLFSATLDGVRETIPWITLVTPFIFFWMVVIFSFERGYVSALLDRPMFHKLGDLSFSMYVIHWPLLIVFLFVVGEIKRRGGVDVLWYAQSSRLLSFLGIFPFMALVIAISRLTFAAIEVPWRDRFAMIGRGIERRGRPSPRAQTVR